MKTVSHSNWLLGPGPFLLSQGLTVGGSMVYQTTSLHRPPATASPPRPSPDPSSTHGPPGTAGSPTVPSARPGLI